MNLIMGSTVRFSMTLLPLSPVRITPLLRKEKKPWRMYRVENVPSLRDFSFPDRKLEMLQKSPRRYAFTLLVSKCKDGQLRTTFSSIWQFLPTH